MNLTSSKVKLEQELTTLAGDYEEVTKELRVSDERYQRVQTELKHTVEILHEEQERIVKIESIKKSLEIEVKNLSVRLEEVEANAIVGGKRIISKLEARVSRNFFTTSSTRSISKQIYLNYRQSFYTTCNSVNRITNFKRHRIFEHNIKF